MTPGVMLCYLGIAEKHTGKGYSVPHSNTALILKHKQRISASLVTVRNKYFGLRCVTLCVSLRFFSRNTKSIHRAKMAGK